MDARTRRCGGVVEVATCRPFYSPGLHLMVLVDDSGRAVSLMLSTEPSRAEMADVFRRHVEPGSEIRMRMPARTAIARGALAAGFVVRSHAEVDAARRYAADLRWWLRKFYGTDATWAYLAWYDATRDLPDVPDFVAYWMAEAGFARPGANTGGAQS